jgi:hypothetical protein
MLKRQMGGVVRERKYFSMGEIYKEPSENILPIGPFSVDGKSFVAVVYFDNWSYRRWILRNSINVIASFFLPTLLLEVQKSCFES